MLFKDNDENYIVKLIGQNQVVLFLGAGFSFLAKNRLNQDMPSSRRLSEKLWTYLNLPGAYDPSSSLIELFTAFTSTGNSTMKQKEDFLVQNLMCNDDGSSVPHIYDSLALPLWYKIYTTNVDNVLDVIYKRAGKHVQNLIYPKDEYGERDQLLEKPQIVYLHGKLPCSPMDMIFSTQQYAASSSNHQPLYNQFTREYSSMPTIFLGTELNEPLFEQYIELRKNRHTNNRSYNERRPKSFIISPSISAVKAGNLKNLYNVHHIEGKTEDFLDWLNEIASKLPDVDEVIKTTFPKYWVIKSSLSAGEKVKKAVEDFSMSIERVSTFQTNPNKGKSLFLLGSCPQWEDIDADLDIPRTITKSIHDICANYLIDYGTKQPILSIIGTAGSGKSTIIRRLATIINKQGYPVFFSESEGFPQIDSITSVLGSINQRSILIFDNARNILSHIPNLVSALATIKYPPIIIVTLRPNQIERLNSYIDPDIINHTSFQMPDLDDNEISNLIEKLKEYNLLGVLKGKSDDERFASFKYVAKKQILVAMKEATKGEKFENIIRNEYNEIISPDAKQIYSCIALCSELGYSLTRQDILSFSNSSSYLVLNIIDVDLKGLIIRLDNDKYALRHRVIAEFIISNCLNASQLKDIYIKVLSGLSSQLLYGYSPKFSLFKALINHKTLYSRFLDNIQLAREVYDSTTTYFGDNAHFWLQYASLEIEGEGGNLKFAENYLDQAESLSPNNPYMITTRCLLYFKQSTKTNSADTAFQYKQRAEATAESLRPLRNINDEFLYHVLLRGRLEYINKWELDLQKKKGQLIALRKEAKEALSLYPRSRKLIEVEKQINYSYLSLAI